MVELEPDVHQLRVRAHLQVAANQPLAVLTFYLSRNLKVQAVRGPDGRNLHFEQPSQTDAFQVDLREPLAAEQTLGVQVDYAGVFDPALRPERGPVLARIAPGASYLLPESRWFPQSRQSVAPLRDETDSHGNPKGRPLSPAAQPKPPVQRHSESLAS